ncbi:MAG: DUF368 domain-containing protein [Defluviitaleaceae bacterium]|nr:DUF368 domain-containing protein [Defluviitaleaceae bacterium]
MNIITLLLKGMAIGGSNVMPGISGATVAVILRVYDVMIKAVNNLFKDMKGSLRVLIPIGLGMVLGIFAIGEVAKFLLERFSLQTGGLMAGLMAGSLPFIYTQAVAGIKGALPHSPDSPVDALRETQNINEPSRSPYKYYALAAIGTFTVIFLSLISPDTSVEAASATASAGLAVHLFIGGVFAAAAMVIPGISGAMVLILLGLYPIALSTITAIREFLMSPSDFQLLGEIIFIVAPLGLGIVAGILLGTKLIAMLLEKFCSETYFVIFGLILGTVFVVFNNAETYQSHDTITPLLIASTCVVFVLGVCTSLKLSKKP